MIIVLIEFPDVTHTASLSTLRSEGQSLIDFYLNQSYGKLQLQVDVDPHWHMASKSFAYYQSGNTYTQSGLTHLALIKEALSDANSEVDYSKYNFVIVLHASSYGYAWAYSPELGSDCITQLGQSCQDRVALVNEYDFRRGVGFHEFGHLLGLPDFYSYDLAKKTADSSQSDVYVYGYELMGGSGNYVGLSAWSRIKLRWIPNEEIITTFWSDTINTTLSPLESGVGILAIKITLPNRQYYLIEDREGIGADSHISGQGVLIYLVNDALESGYGPLRLVSPQPFNLQYDLTSDSLHNAFFDETNNVAIITSSKSGSAYQVAVMPLAAGREAYQRIHDRLKSEASDANSSIDAAYDAIQNATRTGRTTGVYAAHQLCWQASVAYAAGDYETAKSLAARAKNIADSSTAHPSTVTTELTRPPQEQQTVLQDLQSLVSRLPVWFWAFPSALLIVGMGSILLIRKRKIRRSAINCGTKQP